MRLLAGRRGVGAEGGQISLLVIGFAVILLAPLTGVVGRLALALSGNAAVADQDIARFLLSPVGLGALILIGALTVLVLLLEQASQMALGAMGLQEHRPATHRGIGFGLGRFAAPSAPPPLRRAGEAAGVRASHHCSYVKNVFAPPASSRPVPWSWPPATTTTSRVRASTASAPRRAC